MTKLQFHIVPGNMLDIRSPHTFLEQLRQANTALRHFLAVDAQISRNRWAEEERLAFA